MTELSIIVAIYNIETYLRECIDSILGQKYRDYELILVDDGSNDSCPMICDEYARKDNRVNVIHQNNQGSVKARWNGLLQAKGKYISMINGDDWVDSDMYLHMLELIKKNDSDIVVVGYKEQHGNVFYEKRNAVDSGLYENEAIGYVYRNALYTGTYYVPGIVPAFWNKLVRRELYFDDMSPADSIVKMGEDAVVTYPLIARAKSIVVENEFHPYNYRVLEGSMSREYDSIYFQRIAKLLTSLKDNLKCAPLMSDNLGYYGLFLIEIGVNRMFSKANKNSFFQKKNELKLAQNTILKIGVDFSLVDWDSLERRERNLLHGFVCKKPADVIYCLYLNRVIRKIGI